MTDAAYDVYVDHLVEHLRPEDTDLEASKLWNLLVCDGYNSHAMLPEALDKLWKAQVYAVSFPSHTSSELQPLDITCFRPLKGFFRQAVHAARLDNGFLSINKWSFPEIICGAMKKALTSVIISACFAKAGFFPFNKD